jgi:hypothetical protein
MSHGAVVRAMKSTYKRNGTLNLFAALEIASGQSMRKRPNRKSAKTPAVSWTRSLRIYPPTNKST